MARDRCARAVRLCDRVQHHQHRGRAVVRVRVDLAGREVDRLAELLGELLARGREVLVRLTGDGDVHALRRVAGMGDRVLERAEPVRSDDHDAVAETGAQVLDQLAAVLALEAAEEHGPSALVLDLRRDVLVARGLRVPGLVADDLETELLRRVPEGSGDTCAVRFLVVEDIDLRCRSGLRRRRSTAPTRPC